MNLEKARFNMIEQQVRPWDVLDQNVLNLLTTVKREEYVPAALRRLAFADAEIPLGHGAVMLAPKIEAHAVQALQPKKHEKVLEIGTGTGYMAALLAAHAAEVLSVEIVPALAETARNNLRNNGVDNVTVEVADGREGAAAAAPFDVIMVSGSVAEVPAALKAQLKVGGRMFVVVGQEPVMCAQLITRVSEDNYSCTTLFETVIAPLTGAAPSTLFSF